MKIERARKHDFAEIMDLMLRAFRTVAPDHDRFEELFPDLYQPTSDSMGCNYVIRSEGKIASMAGLFPVMIKMGNVRLSVAGVGGVCTDPRHRGKGGMTALMNKVCDEIRAAGYPLAWLTGERDRYARFGWEKAGSETVVQIQKRRPDEGLLPWKISEMDPVHDLLEPVLAARDALEVKGLCDDETFRLKLRRKHSRTWQASLGKAFSYLVVNQKVQWVCEWGGDVEGVRALLSHAVRQCGPLNVRVPALRDQYSPLWLSVAQQYGGPLENLAVFDLLGVLKAYKAYLAGTWPREKTLSLLVKDGDKTLMSAGVVDGRLQARAPRGAFIVSLSRLQMVSFLFGPQKPSVVLELPPEARWLDQVFPLPFVMPSLWRV